MPPRKGGLYKRLAKTTGTTTKEAQGVVKSARTTIAKGNRAVAAKKIEKALSGGPKAGVKKTPKRSRKAKQAARKITRRIQKRQRVTKRTASTRSKKAAAQESGVPTTDGGPSSDFTSQFSAEQLSVMGGADKLREIVANKERAFAEGRLGYDPWMGTSPGSISSPDIESTTTEPTRGKKPKRTAGRSSKRRVGTSRRRGR